MAIWSETTVSEGSRLVTATGGGLSIAFFRKRDQSGWVMMNPAGDVAFGFDEFRPPVLTIAESEPFDLALIKSISDRQFYLDPTQPPSFTGEKDLIGARIWHGNSAEGLGFFGRLVNGSSLSVVVYRSDFDVMKITFPLDSADLMRRVLCLP